MEPAAFKKQFLDAVEHTNGIHLLFENLPNIFFWIKDAEGRFVTANQAFVEKCGCRNENEIIGKIDPLFFPKKLADNYRQDDILVAKNKEKILNKVELVVNEMGTIHWHSTNKIPLFDKTGKVIGVAGTTRSLEKSDPGHQTYQEMSSVIEYISKNYREPLEIKHLAAMANLSVSQFERKFKQYFHETPVKFIIKVRISAACKELINTNRSISNIAFTTGFYDQSYFSKKFTAHMGMTPGQYRTKYFKGIS